MPQKNRLALRQQETLASLQKTMASYDDGKMVKLLWSVVDALAPSTTIMARAICASPALRLHSATDPPQLARRIDTARWPPMRPAS